MTGRAADISVKSMAGVTSNWGGMTDAEKAAVSAIWYKLDSLATGNLTPLAFNRYRDRHFHATW